MLARSLDEVETAFQDAVAGRPAARPFADVCIPSVFDPTLAPAGHHIVSMFTQWVPAGWAEAPHGADLEAYADTVVATMDEVAPGFRDSVLHRTVIGPYEMEHTYGLIGGNIFHGELAPNQLFHMRPAPGWADFRAGAGLYQAGSATMGRRRDRDPALSAVRRAGRAAAALARGLGRRVSGALEAAGCAHAGVNNVRSDGRHRS